MPTWDDRIDEAAHRLTEADPEPGFSTRVLARLDDHPRRWSRAWLLAPAGAIAIAVLAVVMPREEPYDVALGPELTTIERPQAGSMESGASGARVAATDVGPTQRSTNRRSAPRDVRVSAVVVPSAPPSISPSDLDIESIVDPPVGLAPATIAALEDVPPLALDAITNEPLVTQ